MRRRRSMGRTTRVRAVPHCSGRSASARNTASRPPTPRNPSTSCTVGPKRLRPTREPPILASVSPPGLRRPRPARPSYSPIRGATTQTEYRSEREAQAESEDALIHAFAPDAAGAGNCGEAAEIPHRAVSVQLEVRSVGGRVRKVRRVREVEDLAAELRAQTLGE